jgi:hypothetical protein
MKGEKRETFLLLTWEMGAKTQDLLYLFIYFLFIFLNLGEGVEKKAAPILGPIQW